MESILKDFGIQPVLLSAQIVNFVILLYLLKRFLYGPILKILEERKNRISEGLKNASEIEMRLQKTIEEQEKLLEKASKEAAEIVDNATKSSEQIISEARNKAEVNISEMMENGKVALEMEREKLSQEVRAEISNLIGISFEKITGKVLSKKDQESLVKDSVKNI